MILGIIALALIGCGMTPEQEAAKAEEERMGFHCLSAWDGKPRRSRGPSQAATQ